MVLVEGFGRGRWSLTGSKLVIAPFRPLSDVDAAAVLAEAELLLPFVTDNDDTASVAFD